MYVGRTVLLLIRQFNYHLQQLCHNLLIVVISIEPFLVCEDWERFFIRCCDYIRINYGINTTNDYDYN